MKAPSWLADFQARFGAVLRTPLERTTGTLTANAEKYDSNLVHDTRSGLDTYNRQYWFRLFDVLQTAYPLTARLFGLWEFNEVAARFFLAHPPRSWDLDHAPDAFASWLEGDLLLVEAARLDAAWRDVFRAPAVPRFQPSAEGLLDAHLATSPAAAMVEEHAALSELRARVVQTPGESRVPLPPRLDAPRAWMLVRRDEGIAQHALEPREAALLALLREHPVGEALARLEASCPPAERDALPASAQRWLARGMQQGWWSGVSHTRRS